MRLISRSFLAKSQQFQATKLVTPLRSNGAGSCDQVRNVESEVIQNNPVCSLSASLVLR